MKTKPGPSPALLAYNERIKALKAGLPVEPVPEIPKPQPREPPVDPNTPRCSKCLKRERFCGDINGQLMCKKCCREYFDDATRLAVASGAKANN